MTSSKLLVAILLVAALASPFSNPQLNAYEAVEPHMGTLFRIKLYAENQTVAQHAFRAAFDRVDQLERILSDYRAESELSLITAEAVGRPVRVSEDLFRVAEASQQISAETEGAFDLTIGPLTHLWRQARHNQTLPQKQAIQAAMVHCGYQKLHLDRAARTIEFDMPQMLLDAGGIAKGYAADEALAVLGGLGLRSALVAASGDLAFGDAPPGKSGWEIGVDSFDRANKPFTRVLTLSNAGVSTSGSSEQHLNSGGSTYSHIIDPTTGLGLQADLTVTTISRRGITADAAATAISVLGCERGLVFANQHPDLAAYLLFKTQGQVREFESDRFERILTAGR